MKKTFYFSHDYNARNDPKMVKLLRLEGVAGIGIYWCVVEMLYEAGGQLMRSQCDEIAFALHVDVDCIARVVFNYDLFQFGDTYFWSTSVNSRLEERIKKSENASKSAKYRWNNANALQNECEGNAIKERKGKERKINNEPKNIELSLGEPDHVLSDVLKNLPQVSRLKKQLTSKEAEKLLAEFTRPEIESVLESMENYNGLTKKYSSVYLTAKKWMTLNRERQKTNPNAPATKPTYTDSLQDWFNRTSGQSLL